MNNILTAIAQGMNQAETDNDVRLAATRALQNAIEFASGNFDNDNERDYLMAVSRPSSSGCGCVVAHSCIKVSLPLLRCLQSAAAAEQLLAL